MTNHDLVAAEHKVAASIEALYPVFSAPTPKVIEGCPCCIGTRGVDVLLNTSLRQITGLQLWRYVSGAFLTIGSEGDFKYFLPRILETSVLDPSNSVDPEIVLSKLSLTNWKFWPMPEQHVVEEFLDAWFNWVLARALSDSEEWLSMHEVDSMLCGLSRAGLPLDRFLAQLREPSAAPVVRDLRQSFPHDLSAFWEDAPDGFKTLSEFLTGKL